MIGGLGISMRSVASTARGGAVLATLSAVFLAFASPAAAAKSTGELTISPAPNTPDVSPETQISVLGPKPSQIRSVKVTGARERAALGLAASLLRQAGRELRPRPAARRGRVGRGGGSRQGPEDQALLVHRRRPRAARQAAEPQGHPARQARPLRHRARADPAPDHRRSARPSAPPATATSCSPRCPRRSSTPSPTTRSRSSRSGPGGPMIVDEHGELVWFRRLAARPTSPPTCASRSTAASRS